MLSSLQIRGNVWRGGFPTLLGVWILVSARITVCGLLGVECAGMGTGTGTCCELWLVGRLERPGSKAAFKIPESQGPHCYLPNPSPTTQIQISFKLCPWTLGKVLLEGPLLCVALPLPTQSLHSAQARNKGDRQPKINCNHG